MEPTSPIPPTPTSRSQTLGGGVKRADIAHPVVFDVRAC